MYCKRSRLNRQNRRLYDYLKSGQTIHVHHPAVAALEVGVLRSRISDLVNRIEVPVYKRSVEVETPDGRYANVIEYSLKPF